MRRFDPDDFYSWFKFIDIEYLECVNEELCMILSTFDINNPRDQDEVIEIAILPEFIKWNKLAKDSLKQILIDIDKYSETGVREVMRSSSLPFKEELIDYKAFFKKVLIAIER